jgi:citrate synthase
VTTIQPIRTRIWHEEPEPDDAFATRSARCHGFDVVGDLLGRASWAEMMFLLFRGEAPDAMQARVLDGLALVLANPGPRDPAVHAAMCAGVGGSPAAASLMAALAVGAGESGGAREVHRAMGLWAGCGTELGRWHEALQAPIGRQGIWPGVAHPAGFEPHAHRTSTLVLQWLDGLVDMTQAHADSFPALHWLARQRAAVESVAGAPLAATGVAAATLHDLGFTPDQGEMLHLLLRLPGAAAHALEQRGLGHKNFPFFAVELQDDPEETPA